MRPTYTIIIIVAVLLSVLAFSRGFVLPDVFGTPRAHADADSFIVEEYVSGSWQFVASAPFPGRPYPDRYTTKSFILPLPTDRIRITHKGGTQVAHIDAVVLDGQMPASAEDLSHASKLSTDKFARADYDVIDTQNRTIELSWSVKGSSLSVTGVAEDFKGVPYRWPRKDYLNYHVGDAQTYMFAEIPVSSHPFATRFAYFSADTKNLKVTVDWTSDNTLDIDKNGDWVELGVVTKNGLKTFLINGWKTEWGTTDFTYTDKVSWQHKVYSFSIPLSEIGAMYSQDIKFQIRYYGTDGGAAGGDGGGDGGGAAGGDGGAAGDAGGGDGGAAGGDAGGAAGDAGTGDAGTAAGDAGVGVGDAGTSAGDAGGSAGSPAGDAGGAAGDAAGDAGGSASSPAGDAGGSASSPAGDAGGSAGSPAGDAGGSAGSPTTGDTSAPVVDTPTTPPGPLACIALEIPQVPVSCNVPDSVLVQYGIPAGYNSGYASWTLNSCTGAATYTGGCTPPSPAPVWTNYCTGLDLVPPPLVSHPWQIWAYDNSNPINYKYVGTSPSCAPTPVYGCMDATATNYNASATSQTGVICTYFIPPVYGCLDSAATNYNAHATSQVGVTCTYGGLTCSLTANPSTIQSGGSSTLSWTAQNATSLSIDQGVGAVSPVSSGSRTVSPTVTTRYFGTALGAGSVMCSAVVTVDSTVYGCMDATATNYNASATSQTGVNCTYSSGGTTTIYGCMDATATNYNASATSGAGVTCTYPSGGGGVATIYGCMDATATNYNASATSQTGITCTYIIVPPSGGGGGGGGGFSGGGGGGAPAPTISLAVLPHVSAQPLAYLYLSQIPYTGLDLGPVGTVLYWIALIGWALALAYFVLFGAVPLANERLRRFGARVSEALNARALAPAPTPAAPVPVVQSVPSPAPAPEAPHTYSSYDGFKSYARNGALSIEDIVKGLSRHHHEVVAEQEEPVAHTEPVYEHVEPIYEHIEVIQEHTMETIAPTIAASADAVLAPTHVRGFVIALVEGDRNAVFAGLRQHTRGGGVPEHLLSKTVCLIDDVYRSRVDGTACDPDIARMTARLDTPTLEKLISSLTTAIDSSYSTGVTGAKLALTRALAVLGA